MRKTFHTFYSGVQKAMVDGSSDERMRLILEWVGSGKRVLDIACNDGRESERLIRAGNEVYGIEISEDVARLAEQKGVKMSVLDVEEEDLPFPDGFFDAIIACEIIEHLVDTDRFLRQVRSKLKDHGTLVLSTPNLASLGRRFLLLRGKNPFVEFSLEEKVSSHLEPVGHLRYFVRETLCHLLRKHRFQVQTLTSDQLNLGLFTSFRLARWFPALAWRFIVRATKLPDAPLERKP
ncbi:MAG: methyltransferase domain-containing protein [Candidatus Latescibacteria bacterium]|nr:methyltransferase domain-containing protein [Candidatus Latescibacterota bacterium]